MKRLALPIAATALATLSACTTQATPAAVKEPPAVPFTAQWTASYPEGWYACWELPDATAPGGWRSVVGLPGSLPADYRGADGQPSYANVRTVAQCRESLRTGSYPPRSIYVPASGDPNRATLCQRIMSAAAAKGSPLDACKVTQ